MSRFLPGQLGSVSIYEQIREEEQQVIRPAYDDYDLDEQNLNDDHEHDADLDQLLREAAESHVTADTSPFVERSTISTAKRPRWMNQAAPLPVAEDDDIEPGHLLLEDQDLPPPVPGPDASSGHKRSRPKVQFGLPDHLEHNTQEPRYTYNAFADRREKALYRWANVQHLDKFLQEVYDYYVGNGVWSIVLHQALYLLTLAFVVSLTIFLGACVDYSKIPQSTRIDQVLVDKCTQKMSFSSNLLIWLFSAYWIYKLIQFTLDIPRLLQLHDFYLYLLEVHDSEMQTISWQQVVQRLTALREQNPNTALKTKQTHRQWMKRHIGEPTTQRMDAHDIANRLMRKDNYMIALFNKDILDFSLPIAGFRNRQLFSRSIEWNVYACLTDFIFNNQGQVQQLFLKDTSRQKLIEALQRRFIIVGMLNVAAAPFTFVWSLVTFFLRNFTEFKNHPSEIGSRSYTPLAEWKFREFNELQHLFDERKNLSYPFAKHYIDQFPKDKTIQAARFVAFVSGALAAVLAAVSVLDPASFLEFELTKDRTVLFYLGLFGAIWTAARGIVPDENLVFDPEHAMSQVIFHTHYRPDHWKDRLHAEEVRRDFSSLYQMKLVIFAEEMLSILAMPFIFWFSLPPCSERLIDFFREFTVHVDGLGYVCSFAVFDFKQGAGQENRTGGVAVQAAAETSAGAAAASEDAAKDVDGREDYYATKHGKMRDSMLTFRQAYLDPQFAGLRPYAQRAFRVPPSFAGLRTSHLHSSHLASSQLHSSRMQPFKPHSSRGLLESQDEEHLYAAASQQLPRGSHVGSRPLDKSSHRSTRSQIDNQRDANAAREADSRRRDIEDDGPSASVMFEDYDRPGFDVFGDRDRDGDARGSKGATPSSSEQLGEKGGVLGLLSKFTEARQSL